MAQDCIIHISFSAGDKEQVESWLEKAFKLSICAIFSLTCTRLLYMP